MWFLLLLGCALHATRTGRVDAPGAPLVLQLREGGEQRLVPREQDALLLWLEGVELEVSGPRLGRRLWVRDWSAGLTDGGSTPYLGRLHRYGSNWLIEDRVSGGTYQVEPATLGALAAHDGRDVMIEGFVVGAHLLRVVRWRALYAVEGAAPVSGPTAPGDPAG
jgi:hypothetical protein